MSVCKKCGSKLKEGALYCHRCGLKIDDKNYIKDNKQSTKSGIAYSYLDNAFDVFGCLNKIEAKVMGYKIIGFNPKDNTDVYLSEKKPGKRKNNLLVKNELMFDNELFYKNINGFSIRKKKNNRMSNMISTRLEGGTISDEDIIGSFKDIVDSKKVKLDIPFNKIINYDFELKKFDEDSVNDLKAGFIISLTYKDKNNSEQVYAFIFFDSQTYSWHEENKNDLDKLNKESSFYYICNKYLNLEKRGA